MSISHFIYIDKYTPVHILLVFKRELRDLFDCIRLPIFLKVSKMRPCNFSSSFEGDQYMNRVFTRYAFLSLSLATIFSVTATELRNYRRVVRFPIISVYTIEDILSHLAKKETANTCVLFDIDDTLIAPRGRLGTEEWYQYYATKRVNEMRAFGEGNVETLGNTISHEMSDLCHILNTHMIYDPIEHKTAKVVNKAQKSGAVVFALTARKARAADRTCHTLEKCSINFSSYILKSDLRYYNSRNEKKERR